MCALRPNIQSEMNIVKWQGSTRVFFLLLLFCFDPKMCVCARVRHMDKNAKSKSQTKVFDEINPFSQTIAGDRLLSDVHDTMRPNPAEGHNISKISLLMMMMINAMIDKDSLFFLLIADRMDVCGKIITATGTSSRIFGCVLSSCTTEHKNVEAGDLAGSCTIFVSNWTRAMNTWTLFGTSIFVACRDKQWNIDKNKMSLCCWHAVDLPIDNDETPTNSMLVRFFFLQRQNNISFNSHWQKKNIFFFISITSHCELTSNEFTFVVTRSMHTGTIRQMALNWKWI